jgi:hypothetical protein
MYDESLQAGSAFAAGSSGAKSPKNDSMDDTEILKISAREQGRRAAFSLWSPGTATRMRF